MTAKTSIDVSDLSATSLLSSAALSQSPIMTLKTPDNCVNILQLTDPHLYLDDDKTVAGINNQLQFEACLKQALNEDRRCDLILLTGDLVNETHTEIYDRIFERLTNTGIPFACIAGNHDVTDEINAHLPFEQRAFVASEPDSRLLSRQIILANDWKLLLIDSSHPGHISGRIGQKNLDWIQQQLDDSHHPVIIVMHHHVLLMNSAWIDAHMAQDATDLWQHLENSQVKAIITGHVHQHFHKLYKNIDVYATPSTCYQFKPHEDDFALDEDAQPGYRWLRLFESGDHDSWVTRLEN